MSVRRAPASARRSRVRGFTLLEVLVALVIVALGMSALLETLNESARNVMALRDKTVAEWIAMNQIALARLNLKAPTSGTTQGDVQNCANGDWHWREQVSAIDAIPGLLSITVSVKRTGTATRNPSQGQPVPPPGATPGATGALGAHGTLGPTAALGSVSAVDTAGCASFVAPGDSLGNSNGPTLGGMPSLGGASLGNATASGIAGSIGASVANAVTGAGASGSGSASPGENGDASASGSASDQSRTGGWLVTITGFRGNSLGAAVGEDPTWSGPGFNANGAGNDAPVTPGLNGSAHP